MASSDQCPEPADLKAFHQGADLPSGTAVDWLADHLAGCPHCETYLESLDARERTEAVAFRRAAAALPPADRLASFGAEAGAVVGGRYKLIEPLGEGGMGSVWMARQASPMRRTVAVKLIKPGMDSKEVLTRFEAERQALALMDHPNISKVLDAGQTEAGRPFFVMELVRGEPISRYCDDHRLTLRERLKLFIPICQAVQHAHQKGIIHRDLKPTNILVAEYDDRPIPKVIDFGIAKATGQALTDRTLMTGFGAVLGTPEYMSPEQASFNSLDVDGRSDVYSLGVILYELLTGATPLGRPAPLADLAGVLRELRELDPPRPSDRLRNPRTLPTIAAARSAEPRELVHGIRGELDWIVLRALEKDRSRRYQTVGELAADIGRYLDGQPVKAAPPSVVYRAGKFARRHREKAMFLGLLLLASSPVIFSLCQKWFVETSPLRTEREPENASPVLAKNSRAEWEQRVSGLPALEQIKEVHAELKRLNPGYEGTVDYRIDDGVVTKLQIVPVHLTDISPVRVLSGLKIFNCNGGIVSPYQRHLSDLSPLRGLKLTELDCGFLPVNDLRPLEGMPLFLLSIAGSNVPDLSPLRGMKLHFLDCSKTPVADLSPLQGMPLDMLFCNGTRATDLSPLRGMPLMNLSCDFAPKRDDDILKSLRVLRTINSLTPVAFWNRVESADYEAATYLLGIDGKIRVDDQDQVITTVEDLPTRPFRLTHIDMSYCSKITAGGLAACAYCQHVREINFQVTGLTDDGLAFFRNCPDLHVLYLDQTRVTNAGLAWFADRTNVTKLRLDLTSIGDSGIACFKNCKDLVELSLPMTKVTNKGLAHFKDCRHLQRISLDHTVIDNAGIKFLEDCPELEFVGLTDTRVTSAGLGVLKNYPRLTFLGLGRMRMTTEGMAAVSRCENLSSLLMDNADLTDARLEPLGRCKKLEKLSVENATGVTDERLLGLGQCEKLNDVRAKNTAVTTDGVKALKRKLPGCNVFLTK
ncbi:protein kinase domain-containing protein [Zavarzinella formosa]|uniref:protein kinase domain-containing protein n=1 Tax=Zavarzinella formosa TaxID=360055 RepID=UPI0003182A72|nr:protein kinase [Zavarzinella formosa]